MTAQLRIYMAGPVDALPDLGRSWRLEMARAIRERGHEPVWPTTDLEAVDGASPDEVLLAIRRAGDLWRRRVSRAVLDSFDPRLGCLDVLAYDADALLAYWSADTGLGTRAEIAVARWLGKPVAMASDDRSGRLDWPEDDVPAFSPHCMPAEWTIAHCYPHAIDSIERQAAKRAEGTP